MSAFVVKKSGDSDFCTKNSNRGLLVYYCGVFTGINGKLVITAKGDVMEDEKVERHIAVRVVCLLLWLPAFWIFTNMLD